MRCISGKHEWIDPYHAAHCCNGYRRILIVENGQYRYEWMREADCHCGRWMHSGETHAEHMDRFEREQNAALIKRAQELSGGSFEDQLMAISLCHRVAELELARLAARKRYLEAAIRGRGRTD